MITARACAYCLSWLDEQGNKIPQPPDTTEVSHGICKECMDVQLKKIKKLKQATKGKIDYGTRD
jgi:hypothetical protein